MYLVSYILLLPKAQNTIHLVHNFVLKDQSRPLCLPDHAYGLTEESCRFDFYPSVFRCSIVLAQKLLNL